MQVKELIEILSHADPNAEVVVMHYSSFIYQSAARHAIERETLDLSTNQVHRQVWIGDFSRMDQRHRLELGIPDPKA